MNKFLSIALDEWGTTEKNGADKYFTETGRDMKAEDVNWCDAFADWVVMKGGAQPSPGLNARAWLDVGEEVSEPQKGDIVVLWRDKPESWKGHVGFFIRQTDTHVYLLGGNQGDKVQISAYPVKRILGYRRIEVPGLEKVGDLSPVLEQKKVSVSDILAANDALSVEEQREVLDALAPPADATAMDVIRIIEKMGDDERTAIRASLAVAPQKRNPIVRSTPHQTFG